MQSPIEIEQLYRAVCELHPERVFEIDTHRGGTLYLWTQAANEDATILSVELPGGRFGGGYDAACGDLYRAFARPDQYLVLLRADSHLPQTRQRVKNLFNGEPIDFLFVDGDHTYDGVRSDFFAYGPLVRPGGRVRPGRRRLLARRPGRPDHRVLQAKQGRDRWQP